MKEIEKRLSIIIKEWFYLEMWVDNDLLLWPAILFCKIHVHIRWFKVTAAIRNSLNPSPVSSRCFIIDYCNGSMVLSFVKIRDIGIQRGYGRVLIWNFIKHG